MKQRIALVGGILCVHPVCGLEMATQMISFQLKEERGEEGGEERKSDAHRGMWHAIRRWSVHARAASTPTLAEATMIAAHGTEPLDHFIMYDGQVEAMRTTH